MADYTELHSMFEGASDLRNKVQVAVIIAADTIWNEDGGTDNHANRLLWAADAFASPKTVAVRMLMAVLAANKGETIENIQGASDAQIQTKVDAAVDLFATGA